MQYRFHVTVSFDGLSFQQFERHRARLLRRFATAFNGVGAELADGFVKLTTTDWRRALEIRQWAHDNSIRDLCVSECSVWPVTDLFRARYVPLLAPSAREAERDQDGLTFNEYPTILCDACGWYDEADVVGTFKIVGSYLRERYELFLGFHARLIVNERVLSLFRATVGDEVIWGPVETLDNPKEFYWLRPKHEIGHNPAVACEGECAVCGRPRKCWKDLRQGGLGGRIVVSGFGPPEPSIAAVGSFIGQGGTPERRGQLYLYRAVVLSGGLFAYLLSKGVKGLLIPEGGVFSTRPDEEPLEREQRFSGLMSDQVQRELVRRVKKRKRDRTH